MHQSGRDLDPLVQQLDQRLAAFRRAIDDDDLGGAGQAQFDGDGPGGAARPQDDHPFAGWIRHVPQGLDEAFAIRIFANQLLADPVDAVHRPHQRRRFAQFVQVGNDGNFVRNGEIAPLKSHGPQALDGVGEFLRRHFQRQISPVQARGGKSPLHHELSRIASHGLAHATNNLLNRRIRHKASPSSAKRFGRAVAPA